MKIDDWTERFAGTAQLPRAVRDRLLESANIIRMKAGAQIFDQTDMPDHLFFLYDGQIRISQTSKAGREIVLYRVVAGESCVMTTACILAEDAYYAEGIAETDIIAVTLPKAAFDQLLATEEAFRAFVLAAYSQRFIDLMRVIKDVAFARMDVRLADRLLSLSNGAEQVHMTHQELAVELGTAREVVSRVLHDLQERGMVAQFRGRIDLLDKAGLKQLAASD